MTHVYYKQENNEEKGIPGFKITMDKMYETMLKKNADYTGNRGAFDNFTTVEKQGICSTEEGILVRMQDKMCRIITLLNNEAQVKDEAIVDTLQDLANYAIILKCYIENKNTIK